MDEVAKLHSFYSTRPVEKHLNQLSYLAAFLCSAPAASITVLDEHGPQIKAIFGLDVGEAESLGAPYVHAALNKQPLIIEDTLKDDRFSKNPLVCGDLSLRFYAGIPLISGDCVMGTLAVMDNQSRKLEEGHIHALTVLAGQVVTYLETRQELLSLEHITNQSLEFVEHDRAILHSVNDAIYSLNKDWKFSYANREAERLLGTTQGGLTGKEIWQIFPEMVDTTFEYSFREVVKTREKVYFEAYYRPSKAWLRVNACPLFDGIVVRFQDITQQRKQEEQFKLLETCIARMNDIVVITEAEPFDEPGPRILFVNDAFIKRTGYSRDEVIGRSPRFLQGEKTQRSELVKIKESMRKWKPVRAELINYTKSGEEFWLELDIFPIADETGWYTHWVAVERDVTERKLIESRLYENEQRFKLIAKATADAIWDWDLVTDDLWWNDGMQTLFGYDSRELERNSTSWTNRIHPDDAGRVLSSVTAVIASNNNNWMDEYRFRRIDGTYAHVSDRGFVIRVDGKALRMVGGMTDVSLAKHAEMELQQLEDIRRAQQVAELASQAKSNFLATMSHEIRTPINGVVGMVEVLQQTSLKGYQLEMTEIIKDSAHSLLAIVDDILNFSKIESGKMELESISFSLEHCINRVCTLLDRMAIDRNVELSVFTAHNLPSMVKGDELRLRQILINLINNAIKFSASSSSGTVRLNVNIKQHQEECVLIQFEVVDNGIGMSQETIRNLFTPFMQADASTTRHYGGTGLGLTITWHLVELMGGEIHVESTLGAGSTFIVNLPFELQDSTQPTAPELDMNDTLCIVIGKYQGLADLWQEYLSATNARILRYETFDNILLTTEVLVPSIKQCLLLLDHTNIDLDIIHECLAFEKITHFKIAYLLIGRGLRREIRKDSFGIAHIDGNALSRSRFMEAVSIALGQREFIDSIEQTKHEADFILPSRELAEAKKQLILLVEDNETNQKVIKHQLALLGYVADIVPNGLMALDKLHECHYGLVITDLHMPRMDGYELIAKIRMSESDFRSTPIIALSANALKDRLEECRTLGANEYLVKPALLHELKKVLEKYLAPTEGISLKKAGNHLAEENVHFNVDFLIELVGNEKDIIIEFLQDYLASTDQLQVSINSAYQARDFKNLASLAHKLKSSSRSVGAFVFSDICERLEKFNYRESNSETQQIINEFNAEYEFLSRSIYDFLSDYQTTL